MQVGNGVKTTIRSRLNSYYKNVCKHEPVSFDNWKTPCQQRCSPWRCPGVSSTNLSRDSVSGNNGRFGGWGLTALLVHVIDFITGKGIPGCTKYPQNSWHWCFFCNHWKIRIIQASLWMLHNTHSTSRDVSRSHSFRWVYYMYLVESNDVVHVIDFLDRQITTIFFREVIGARWQIVA